MFFNGLSPKPEKCCGCEGCKEICPKSAIKITTDKDGFIMPVVDMNLCIECGLCEKVCPMVNTDKAISQKIGNAYAAVNRNTEELSQSSSGGVFSLIAGHVLDNGGIVAGAAFDGNLILGHILISSRNEMPKLRGSKYLQSKIDNIYRQIKQELDTGILVYFVGTACQVAGLKLFLRKKYENLITSDILCHGVPPQSVFSEMIRAVESKYHGKILHYSFRDKSVWGWSCSSSSSIEVRGELKYLGNETLQRAYFNAYIKGVNYRESCYVCPYAQSKRSGDITLGDYWGVEKYIPISVTNSGVSAILINTSEGERIFSNIKDHLDVYPSSIESISEINKTLVAPTGRPKARDIFFKEFRTNPVKVLLSYYTPNRKRDLLYALKRNPLTSRLLVLIKKYIKR